MFVLKDKNTGLYFQKHGTRETGPIMGNINSAQQFENLEAARYEAEYYVNLRDCEPVEVI